MPYIIDNRAGQTIVIPDGALNQDFSIDLVGRNYENYGAVIARSFIDLLDNFASDNSPSNQTNGQLWYDTAQSVLRVYDSQLGVWKPVLPIITEVSNPPGENATATTYFDKQIGKFFINDGTEYRMVGIPGEINSAYSTETALGNPAEYGTRLRNIFLEDTDGVERSVTAVCTVNSSGATPEYIGNEKIVAILSGHDEFEIADTPSSTEGQTFNFYSQLSSTDSIGTTIRPGLNLRADNDTEVERAQQALRADAAYALNTGSYGSDSANISASQVFFDSAHSVPSANATYNIGSQSAQFNQIHAQEFIAGSSITVSADDVNLGTTSAPVNEIFVTSIEVQGDISLPNGGDIGEESSPITNGYFDNLYTDYLNINGQVFPTSSGTNGQQLFVDGTGTLFWRNPVSDIAHINARGGTTSANSSVTVDGVSERTFTIDIGAGDGITVFDDFISVNLSDFDTDNLSEGSSNLYFSNVRSRAAIDVTDNGGYGSLSYNATSGMITYNGPSASDVRGALNNGTGISYNASTGVISSKDSEIDHDKLKGFVSNEHINHSSVSITAGLGLTGGGNITADRTLNVATASGVKIVNDKVVLDVSYARTNVYSAGQGISIDGNGRITNTGVVTAIDTSGFVTTGGRQTIGGAKKFTKQINAADGIYFSATDQQNVYNNQLTWAGALGTITMWGDSLYAEGDIVAYSNFSDSRLKENLRPLTGALNSVCELNGYTFNYINKPEKRVPGLIAQDVQKVLPEAVFETKEKSNDGDAYLGVNYETLVPLLVEAIKELRDEVNSLKQELSQDGSK